MEKNWVEIDKNWAKNRENREKLVKTDCNKMNANKCA